MRYKQILTERILNLTTQAEKEQYKDEVWALLVRSYEKAGGFKSAVSPDELVNTTNLWKLVVRPTVDGKRHVSAANIYRDAYGRKSVAAGTDGTVQGKKDYMMVKSEDVKLRRAWAEVSGAPEAIFRKSGAQPISNKLAAKLTGKEIISLDPDGFHYTRLILGEPHTKMIMGWPKGLSPEDIAEIESKTGTKIQQ